MQAATGQMKAGAEVAVNLCGAQLLQSKRRVAIIQITSHKSNTTTVRTAIKRCVGLQESL